MELSEQKRKEFEKLAEEMINFLNENTHPHCSVHITTTSAELVEGVAAVRAEQYNKGKK